MTNTKITAFERFFDRSASVFVLLLGAALAGATVLVGA
ncbi:hypothetical protein QO010_003651 [Caulobacter ginsengisoli]|uniref:Uncharacterized protein n=1 Tax=Caulobacter ginsengisoli TaxID=400775 RepID=A0ABU0IV31_9CAUL|nr:hypothetical protein [Caulobacter ginsengisoli]